MIDWLAGLDPQALISGVAIAGVLFAFPLLLVAVRRMRRLRLVRGTLFLLAGAFVMLVLALAGLVAGNLVTYSRLTHEEEAARVTARRLGDRFYEVEVKRTGTPVRYYEISGDEWQIDARVLKWRPLGTLIGLDTLYRLERISGRYGDVASELSAPRTVHDLSEPAGLDLWAVIRRHGRYLPLADALYGSAAFVPMADGAEYAVSVSASGLVVRPANDTARDALGAWR